jgi:hypothetical protein
MRIVPEISNINNYKIVEFCNAVRRWTQNLQKVILSDESCLCAEAFHLRYVRRFADEMPLS